jgi:CubicO group peptidase (beta-lactamase class C family)
MRNLLALLVLTSPVAAQAPDAPTLVRWVDSLATSAITKGPLAGLAIVVARGDRILLAKGYGFADLENRIPRPRDCLRIGSLTKQFTTLAIMQLVAQKKPRCRTNADPVAPGTAAGGHHRGPAAGHDIGAQELHVVGPAFMNDTFRLELSTARMAEIISAQQPDFAPAPTGATATRVLLRA